MITTRKLKLAIVSENKQEGYDFLKYEMFLQYKALNFAYQQLVFEKISQDKIKEMNEEYQYFSNKYKAIEKEKRQEYQLLKVASGVVTDLNEIQKKELEKAEADYEKAAKKVIEIEKKYSKESSETFQKSVGLAKQTRIGKLVKRKFDLHYDTVDRIVSTVTADYSTDLKNGVLSGERNYRHYKKTNPLYVRARSMKLYEENGGYYLKWINGILFKIIIKNGSKQKGNIGELISTLSRIIEGDYKLRDSSILYDKNGNLILNLSLDIPITKENLFIPSRVVGVDLGLKIPAYVSLNDTPYIRKAIGSIEDFLKVRTQLQNQHKRLQKALKSTAGSKGRDKKLKALERLKEKEKNFVNTYNHFLSKSIINFALKNNAGMIHMEELKFDKLKHKSLLRNWSYYQLQSMIKYKAEREGIKVFYVDANYTSQTCSKCGNLEDGQREKQESFACKNCGYQVNADYNASQNIAKSELIIINK